MKIFLDDYRQPNHCLSYMDRRIGKDSMMYAEDWLVVKNYEEFVAAVIEYGDTITHVSFDHDLALEHYETSSIETYDDHASKYMEKTGYDCAVWYKEYLKHVDAEKFPMIYVHSMNPVGVERILNVFM